MTQTPETQARRRICALCKLPWEVAHPLDWMNDVIIFREWYAWFCPHYPIEVELPAEEISNVRE